MLYTAQAGSPETSLLNEVLASDTTISVVDSSVFAGLTLPNLLTIAYNQATWETVIVTAINGNALTVTRGVEGAAAAWPAGTSIARVFTAYDWNNMIADKQDAIGASGILKGDGAGGVSGAVAGTDYAVPSAIPSAYTSNPAMNGSASPGSGTAYSRGNHVHPVDTSRQAKITASGILKGNGSGTVSAATAGTDYVSPSVVGVASGIATLDSDSKVSQDQASAKIVSVSANVTFATATHAGALLLVTQSPTITVPTGIGVGTEFEVLNYGSGVVTIKAASGVTLNGASGGSKTINNQYTSAVLKCVASNAWVVQGAIA